MKNPRHFSPLLALALVLLAPSAHADLFIDDDFSSPDYSFNFVAPLDPTDESTSSFMDLSSGGNPTFYRTINHEHDLERNMNGMPVNGTGLVTHQSILFENTDTWQPTVDGEIQSLTFSIDVRSSEAAEVYFTFANQLGSGFAGGFTPFTPSVGWQTITVSGLTEADFIGSDFATSDQLKFGFGFFSSDNVTTAPSTFSFDVDNFKLEITPVPEPSVAVLAGLGTIGLLRRRRSGAGC
jgi:MYXO-CTERM domain-containing protein